eukprot:352955-Chlamydomonas_euryale.AAC.1
MHFGKYHETFSCTSSQVAALAFFCLYPCQLLLVNAAPEFEVVTGLLFRTDDVSNPASLPGGGNKTNTLVALSVIDMLAVLAFFGFCLYFITWTYRKAKNTLQTTVTIKVGYNQGVKRGTSEGETDGVVRSLWQEFVLIKDMNASVVQVDACVKLETVLPNLVVLRVCWIAHQSCRHVAFVLRTRISNPICTFAWPCPLLPCASFWNLTYAQNYSVRVRDVPHDVDVEDLWEHFSKYGESVGLVGQALLETPLASHPFIFFYAKQSSEGVMDPVARIDLAYACFDLMDMVMERHKIVDKCERALAVLQRSAEALPKVEEAKEIALLNHQYDLQLVNRAIQNQQDIFYSKSTGQRSDIVGAFVVFKEEVSKERCLKAQPTLLFGCIHRPMPEELLFLGKHPLRVTQAPEPTDLKYENLEISDFEILIGQFWLLIDPVALNAEKRLSVGRTWVDREGDVPQPMLYKG